MICGPIEELGEAVDLIIVAAVWKETRISQMRMEFGDIAVRFRYKNQAVVVELEGAEWLTPRVKAKRGPCGWIST